MPVPTRSFSSPASFASIFLFVCLLAPFSSSGFAAADIRTYEGLVEAIRAVRLAGQEAPRTVVDQERAKLREAWEMGQLIDAHVRANPEKVDVAERVTVRLAPDLSMSRTELGNRLRFFRMYRAGSPAVPLFWAHYVELLPIHDDAVREEIVRQAVSEHWTRQQVRDEVVRQHDLARARAREEAAKPPVFDPESMNTYRVVKPTEGPHAGQLVLDVGFSTYFRPGAELPLDGFQEGDVVRLRGSVFEKVKEMPSLDGNGIPFRNTNHFTYKAYLVLIVDGDTLHVGVDLGFNIVTIQKLRLRGLDAPEAGTPGGDAAREYLEEKLGPRGTPLLIKIATTDKYNRYLADVWTTDGAYVNQLLIDKGFAVQAGG